MAKPDLAAPGIPATALSTPAAFGRILGSVLMWGSMVPIMALVILPVYDPIFTSALRYLISVPALLGLLYLLDRPATGSLGRLPARRILMLGAILASFSTLYAFAILLSEPVTAAVVLSTSPLIAAVLSKLLYRHRFPPGLAASLGLAVAGGLLVATGKPETAILETSFRGGELLMLVTQSLWILYSLKVQEWFGDGSLSALAVTTWTSCVACALQVVLFAALWRLGVAALPSAGPIAPEALAFVWISVGAGGVAIVFWNAATARVGVPVAALYLNLIPIVALVISAALGVAPTGQQMVGGALVLAGVLNMQVRQLRAARRA